MSSKVVNDVETTPLTLFEESQARTHSEYVTQELRPVSETSVVDPVDVHVAPPSLEYSYFETPRTLLSLPLHTALPACAVVKRLSKLRLETVGFVTSGVFA